MLSNSSEANNSKVANADLLRKRRKRLLSNERALSHVTSLGVSPRAVEHFKMGLAEPYHGADNRVQENALVFPLMRPDGMPAGRYGNMNIPGVTLSPQDEVLGFWMSGEPRSYFSDAQGHCSTVIVVSDPAEVWVVWDAVQTLPSTDRLLVLSSTDPVLPPSEWTTREFWKQWDRVYLGFTNSSTGTRLSEELAKVIEQEVLRLPPPRPNGRCDGSWACFFRSEGSTQFAELLADAPKMGTKVLAVLGADEIGRQAFDPINIDGAFHDGQLYYTVRTLVRGREATKGADGEPSFRSTEHQETIVVRSDRTFHTAVEMPSPRGTPKSDRIWRLGNTTITRPPRRNRFATWRWKSIAAYKEGQSETRSLKEILGDIHETLLGAVYLPNLDHELLSLVVVVTYVQEIFDSVPLILAVGPAGSGKTTLGKIMANLCANGHILGVASPAAIARTIDEVRGFTVLDDLEGVRQRRGTAPAQFSDLVQSLKVSYSKDTATKTITEGGTSETLNLFGVKLINNISGVDAILGTRMLKIQTAKMPRKLGTLMDGLRPGGHSDSLAALRDELHTWAFLHAADIERIYRNSVGATRDRFDEITLPIRVIEAFLDGQPSAAPDIAPSEWFSAVMSRQNMESVDTEDHDALLRAAVDPAIVRGQTEISTTYVLLRMRALAHAGREAGQNPDVSMLSTTRVGRMMRRLGMVDKGVKESRFRLHNYSLRIYPLNGQYVTKVLGQAGYLTRRPIASPTSFCGACEDCALSSHGCAVRVRRLARAKRSLSRRSLSDDDEVIAA